MYVDVPHSLLEWILVLGDFAFGQFMLVAILSFIAVPISDLVIPSKMDWFPHESNIDQIRHVKNQDLSAGDSTGKGGKRRRRRRRSLGKDVYSWILYAYAILQTFNIVFSLWMTTGLPLHNIKFFTHAVSLGMTSAVSVSISHELFHKFLDPIDSFVGKWVLNLHMYNHFWIAHVFNHHKDVATSEDPATASRNQTLYTFWLQSAVGGYINAWKIELDIMKRKGIRFWELDRNRMLKYAFINLVTMFGVWLFLGRGSLITFIIQCIVASFFIEAVNYIEHYGLVRKKLPGSDRYEPVSDAHSWDAPFRLSSFVYLNILMHSDHHAHPTKEYSLLEMKSSSPKLPYTYATMVLLALYPPLFFGCIHPILDRYVEEQDMNTKQ